MRHNQPMLQYVTDNIHITRPDMSQNMPVQAPVAQDLQASRG